MMSKAHYSVASVVLWCFLTQTELFRVPDIHSQGRISQHEVISRKSEGSCRLCSWGQPLA